MPSTQRRHLVRLGLHVEQKPNGRPLVARSEYERVLGAARLADIRKQPAGDVAEALRIAQNKTGSVLEIALEGDLLTLIESAVGDVPVLRWPIVHRHRLKGADDDGAYTYSGISAMLKRAQKKARKQMPTLESFGFRDLKGKGATDMWLAGEPIERIQALCGHKDKATTEIYVKQRWRESVPSNSRKISG